MYSLRSFGGVLLAGPDGRPLAGPAVQRRRLALLALMACSPHAAQSREKLASCLWPVLPTPRALHRLADAVFVLRQTLGGDAIRGRGADLMLDPELVRSDVAEFLAAQKADDHARMVELYGGPFLDGFFVNAAPEFERWVDTQRDRFARAFLDALRRLADLAERGGDPVAAAGWWRAAAAHDRYSGATVLRLMDALAAAGDPHAALREAEAYALRLEEELGLPPDPRVAERSGRLRADLTRRVSPEPGPVDARVPEADSPARGEAGLLYLKGRYFWSRRTDESLQHSVRYFQEALRHDPDSARAWAGLADSYAILAANGHRPPAGMVQQARRAALNALRLDEHIAQPYATLGLLHFLFDRRLDAAERAFDEAVRLDSAYATAHLWRAWNHAAARRFDDAIASIRVALDLDPLSLVINTQLGTLLTFARRYDEAAEAFGQALEMDPHFDMAHCYLAELHLERGACDEALTELDRIHTKSGEFAPAAHRARAFARMGETSAARSALALALEGVSTAYVPPSVIAAAFGDLGDMDNAMSWLERAIAEKDSSLALLNAWPRFDPLRQDPRFPGLLTRLGLD